MENSASYDGNTMSVSKGLTSELEEAYNDPKNVYDSVGQEEFGKFALLKYQGTYYIRYNKGFETSYISYKNQQAAGRAWGHICERFERWWTERNA